ncbi:hypothetical protein PLICRDRAFT_57339 [Plicaturopsis crispa FD-325 SS-3]|uniref:Unplaced genomic scaffold PLICRscaffold_16, whole genome shotgun sequence n=1 Tax=Plicaturopsis crispa FD-325 SS-3 TaxID=944288 RepID=A0A0C9SRM8_PLICR|nr:hypothetical protein PLICRDRAFT_57339 [Plicaturopsis crispa FD-325 SS-3]
MSGKWQATHVQTHEAQVLEARIGVLFIILFVSLVAVSFPAVSKSDRLKFLRIPRIVFFVGKHFGTGVILSTAFVHLLQDAFEAFNNPAVKARWKLARWAGLIILASLLLIFLVEYTSTAFVDRLQSYESPSTSPDTSDLESSSSTTPPSPTLDTIAEDPSNGDSPPIPTDPRAPLLTHPPIPTKNGVPGRSVSYSYGTSENTNSNTNPPVPPSSLQFFDGHYRYEPRAAHEAHHHLGPKRAPVYAPVEPDHSRIENVRGHGQPHEHGHAHSHAHAAGHSHGHSLGYDEDAEAGAHAVRVGKKRQVVGILVLQMGIMIHSLVIGLTLAITTGSEFTTLVTAIIFHQLFEGLSLGVRIASLPPSDDGGFERLPFLKPILTFLFAITTPAGIVLGLLVFSNGGDADRLKFLQGIMSAISAGMLIYAACVEMLAADFVMDPHLWRSGVWRQALALGSLFAGVVAMTLIE